MNYSVLKGLFIILLKTDERRKNKGGVRMKVYGYARVSSKDQNLDRQMRAFEEFGVKRRNIFSDRKSGKDFERRNYERLWSRLKSGDLLVIKSIDRLGRNYRAIIEEWNKITNVKNADILVLDMPLLDTRGKGETLIGKFISDVVLQVLSFVAENERDNIRTRQEEGIRAAKAKGVKFGRERIEKPRGFDETAAKYEAREITLKDALEKTALKRSTFYRMLREQKAEKVVSAEKDG